IRPALQASKLQPLKVFRGQHEVKLSSRRLQKLTSKFPTTVGLSIRSSLRKPMRIGFTFFAVGISMLLFGSMLFMMNSMEENIIGGLEDKQTWDLQANIPTDGDDSIVQWAEERDSNYELLLNYPLGLVNDNREIMSFGLDNFSTVDQPNSMIIVDLLEGRIPEINKSIPEVLIDQGTSEFLDWDVGQTVKIEVGFESNNVRIVGITSGEISRTMYFHRLDLVQMVEIESTSVLIEFRENNSIEGLAEISTGYTLKQESLDTFDKLLEQQQQVFYAIEFLGIIIAVAVLFNTLLMNLAERDTELATLRVLGAPMNKIGKMMFWEHLGIGLIGGILGSLFAYFGTVLLISSMVQWAFYFTISPDLFSIFIITGVIVGISVALTPIGMHRIKKLDLIEKVKDLSN
ncbi:MAG: ABC transporter permease, partial [Euryarchaeota archaeon]